MIVSKKTREVKALENKIKALEKDLTLHRTLTEIKTILWNKIGQSLAEQWTGIQTMFDQVELMTVAQHETHKARTLLANKPEQATRLIHFLNTSTGDQLAALNIQNRTETIVRVKKVLTMRNFVQTIERKCQEMQIEVNAFRQRLANLQAKGLPNLVTSAGRLLKQE